MRVIAFGRTKAQVVVIRDTPHNSWRAAPCCCCRPRLVSIRHRLQCIVMAPGLVSRLADDARHSGFLDVDCNNKLQSVLSAVRNAVVKHTPHITIQSP
jgi:hypothetical protein